MGNVGVRETPQAVDDFTNNIKLPQQGLDTSKLAFPRLAVWKVVDQSLQAQPLEIKVGSKWSASESYVIVVSGKWRNRTSTRVSSAFRTWIRDFFSKVLPEDLSVPLTCLSTTSNASTLGDTFCSVYVLRGSEASELTNSVALASGWAVRQSCSDVSVNENRMLSDASYRPLEESHARGEDIGSAFPVKNCIFFHQCCGIPAAPVAAPIPAAGDDLPVLLPSVEPHQSHTSKNRAGSNLDIAAASLDFERRRKAYKAAPSLSLALPKASIQNIAIIMSSDDDEDDNKEESHSPLATARKWTRQSTSLNLVRSCTLPLIEPADAGLSDKWDSDKSRDKLVKFRTDLTLIYNDNLFVAGTVVASNLSILSSKNITHILNCAGDACNNFFPKEFTYLKVYLYDRPEEDIISVVYDAHEFVMDALKVGGKILVHCHQGVSRSCVIMISHLMLTLNKEYEECYNIVRATRKICCPNIGFMYQLLTWRKRCVEDGGKNKYVYRVAPHCSRDRQRLVCRLLPAEKSDGSRMDSRGVYVCSLPSRMYVWIGRHCECVNAFVAAGKRHVARLQKWERASQNVSIVRQTDTVNEESKWFLADMGDATNAVPQTEFNEDYTLTQQELDYFNGTTSAQTGRSKRSETLAHQPPQSSRNRHNRSISLGGMELSIPRPTPHSKVKKVEKGQEWQIDTTHSVDQERE